MSARRRKLPIGIETFREIREEDYYYADKTFYALKLVEQGEYCTALALRDGLRNLCSVIKSEDAHLRFTLFTGVSKFGEVSLFSELNNLNDITVDAKYSTICGYTEVDIDTVFAPELAGLDRELIRAWYNGYLWRGELIGVEFGREGRNIFGFDLAEE